MNMFFQVENRSPSPLSVLQDIPQSVLALAGAASIVFLSIAVIGMTFTSPAPQSGSTDIVWEETPVPKELAEVKEQPIYVDVSGAVTEPGMYEITTNTRLTQAVEQAGGLSNEADYTYYYRNFNLAKTLSDQEKIYVPSKWEISSGIFSEEPRQLRYMNTDTTRAQSESLPQSSQQSNIAGKISINTATASELETLPRVGPVTAQKIIDNRPYSSITDLRDTDVIGDSTYTQIESLISL